MGRYVNNHIVTAGYLRRFADKRGLIQPVKKEGPSMETAAARRPETVGYRRHFFADRNISKATERQLSQYEDRGLAALRRIESTWPVEDDAGFQDRLDIACLVALHMVRNPAFRHRVCELQNRSPAENMPEYAADPKSAEAFLRHITSEAFTVPHMLGMIPKLASIIASTHWTLINFRDQLLATSDQPVSVVPLIPEGMSTPIQPTASGGYLFTEEFRLPIDPRHALLFTWANEPDTPQPLAGDHDLAANLNRSVIVGADRDWFHNPERRPTTLPLSAVRTIHCFPAGRLLLPDYGPVAALESSRRIDASACLNEMIENDVTDRLHVARIELA